MINIIPLKFAEGTALGVEVQFPQTKLMAIMIPPVGYLMCGVLNIEALDRLHPERQIVAARMEGVKVLEDLLSLEVKSATKKAEAIGIRTGMPGSQALTAMFEHKNKAADCGISITA